MPDNLLYVERPEYTGIAIAYKNRDFIADMVMPRRSFGAKAFKYIKFNKADRFTPQDTKIGRTSYPNQVEFGGTEVDGRVTDYGLESFVSNEEIKLFSETYDPLGNATELVSELVALGREKRVAGVVFNAGTYATANKTTLSGNDQWSDYSNSDPVEKILESLDALLVRPNKGVFGRPVWTKLRKHPKVVSKVLGSVNASGLVIPLAHLAALPRPFNDDAGNLGVRHEIAEDVASFGRKPGAGQIDIPDRNDGSGLSVAERPVDRHRAIRIPHVDAGRRENLGLLTLNGMDGNLDAIRRDAGIDVP
jgi:hypothetical protein